MTIKRIVYTRPDGGVSVIVPAPNHFRELITRLKREDKAMEDVKTKVVPPDATNVETTDANNIPSDRSFRDAWERDTSPAPESVKVNMPKARSIHMDRIRTARDAKLKDLDLAYMQADELGDAASKKAIVAEKQALRDLPQTFDLNAATTPEDLKALWPSILPLAS